MQRQTIILRSRRWALAGLCAAGAVAADPVSLPQAVSAAVAFVALRFPASEGLAAPAVARRAVPAARPLVHAGATLGFEVALEPTGFVLVRADDQLPVVKVYSDTCALSNLPPAFRQVLDWELQKELEAVAETRRARTPLPTQFQAQWAALLNPMPPQRLRDAAAATNQAGPLLSSAWDQASPYNYYAPTAAGGPGGRAYAGCVATAMAQILRAHGWPAAIATNHTYTDGDGSCQGTHSASDAGLGDYQWQNMPNAVYSSSSITQRQAVGQLIYHCGVAVDMDFEASGSGTASEYVPGALQTYFSYSCGLLSYRSLYSNALWYAKIANDISIGRPIYYGMVAQDDGVGHAVVCDGFRNGNEIHMNFGWSGSATAWYNLDYVNGGGYTWINHHAIFGIAPKCPLVAFTGMTVSGDDDGDGHIEPGESPGLRVWLSNSGDLAAPGVTAVLSSASAQVTLVGASNAVFGTIASGVTASNAVPFLLAVATNCPAGDYAMRLVIQSEARRWTNTFSLPVEWLPAIALSATSLHCAAESSSNDTAALAIVNTGIQSLAYSLYDSLSIGSTNYTWLASGMSNGPLFSWVDIAAIGTRLALDDNARTALLPIGFAFPFFTSTYHEFMISANGAIAFVLRDVYRDNKPLPCSIMYAPGPLVAPFWDDLNPAAGGEIRYYSDGNQLVVSWIAVPLVDTTNAQTFQVILRTSGEIAFQYLAMNGDLSNATVGIQAGNAPAPALPIAYNQPLVTSGLAVRLRPRNASSWLAYAPTEGLLAPGCGTTVLFTCSATGLTNGVYTATAVLSHNDPNVPTLQLPIAFVVPEPAALLLSVLCWHMLRRRCVSQ